MGALAYGLLTVSGIGGLVCFILVLVQMFKREQTGLAIVCIVLALCSGIGSLIAFVYGWIKATEWELKNVMLAWTLMLVLQVVGAGILFGVVLPAQVKDVQQQMQQMQQQIEEAAPEGP